MGDIVWQVANELGVTSMSAEQHERVRVLIGEEVLLHARAVRDSLANAMQRGRAAMERRLDTPGICQAHQFAFEVCRAVMRELHASVTGLDMQLAHPEPSDGAPLTDEETST